MDTRTVVGLGGNALESVLGFRVNAFRTKSFIDVKSIRTSTASSIRAVCKQRGYNGEVPLVNIVEVVENAVASAVEKWNKVADPVNHIDRDWLRHCVCDLLRGAVTHAAFEEIKRLNAKVLEYENEEEEYLDPTGDGCEDLSSDTITTVIHKPAAMVAPHMDDGFYGLQQAQPIDLDSILEPDNPLLPHHEIEQGWQALRNGEVDSYAWATINDPNDAVASPDSNLDVNTPCRKRSAPSTDSDDNDDSEVRIVQPKRCRNVQRDSITPVIEAASGDEDGDGDVDGDEDDQEFIFNEPFKQRKASSKMPWTSVESDLLLSTRDSGKSWDEVHASFGSRTKAAIMHKYRTLKEDERSSSRNSPKEESPALVSQAKKRASRDVSGRGYRL